jgi:hypothetical protein
MEELKTLKDIGEPFACLKKELRQEAIKWVKDEMLRMYDTEKWIREFFNLIEEDLKEIEK